MALIESVSLPIIASIQAGLSGLPFGGSGGATTRLLHTFTGADSATGVPVADTGQVMSAVANAPSPVGIFGVQSNAAYLANLNGATDYTFLVGDAGVSDGTVEWVLKPVTSGTNMASTGGVFRYQDPANLWVWDWNASSSTSVSFAIYKRVAGAFTGVSFTSTAVDSTLGGTLVIVLSGGNMAVTWNGVSVGSLTGQTFLQTATKYGLSSVAALRGTRWDSLKVTA